MSIAGASVSRIELQLVVCDKKVLNAEFKRYFSPLTINKLVSRMPISGLINKYDDNFIYVKTDLDIGVEKPVNTFSRGNIAFSPSGSFIAVFLKNSTLAQKFNLLGNITSDNLDLLITVTTGDVITIRKLGV
ncbi:MAG TPA: cyclophilin-like family protein [Candidatus Nitrosocosmicus sp.]|nr:cyclophilin-like family protein [Candidatus Nitrosocosmicus sp.]